MRFSRSRSISRRIRLLHEYRKIVSQQLSMNVLGIFDFLQVSNNYPRSRSPGARDRTAQPQHFLDFARVPRLPGIQVFDSSSSPRASVGQMGIPNRSELCPVSLRQSLRANILSLRFSAPIRS